ncbi:MBL fold metallo-hydrolase [Anabaenopsis tanganyikae CS-531]|uniref:MBL fold metallo-hydrolase n=2 Tax=Anabaenopsis TaxID=110103 RepID=A0ABT5APK7_9CYAN|nr:MULTISPECIES: MBL fold metallo-hydrolase [Anabaenopsis]MDB9539215.1 MBL fold metallo-hydrolase [Anabaenopsis arnoldii]MDH6091503.1 MBL fold metallo-hydrolase [Anabaenopsis arnoldii]MDH6104465.1 MBL fold metallo-hydrolase [Anabaenopsis tanganyikae CS-531]
MCALPQQPNQTAKPPRPVLDRIFAFPPNRDTLGGTSYLIVGNEGNILIDSPANDPINQDFLRSHGGVRWLFLTHRGAIGKTAQIQQTFGCEVLIQEQEAYLLPGLTLTTFTQEFRLNSTAEVIWTSGHSPGSSCLYYSDLGGVLFSGRHLVPDPTGEPVAFRTPKTFHWSRQIKSWQLLRERFTAETLQYICPGANTGFLRGKYVIDNAYQRLVNTCVTMSAAPVSSN